VFVAVCSLMSLIISFWLVAVLIWWVGFFVVSLLSVSPNFLWLVDAVVV